MLYTEQQIVNALTQTVRQTYPDVTKDNIKDELRKIQSHQQISIIGMIVAEGCKGASIDIDTFFTKEFLG